MKKYIKSCSICNKEFDTNRKATQYCSRKCIAISMIKWKLRDCLFCNKEFKPRQKDDKYCNHKCYSSHKSVLCKERGYAVIWTDEMRKKQSKKYTGKGNPAYGKPSPLMGRARPDESLEKHWKWNGGKFKVGGYTYINKDGRRYSREKPEHRLVMEEHLGRKLLSSEIVHHINHDRSDNRIENLQIVSRAEHINIHREDLLKAKLLISNV